jgi:hypothetical protein
VFVKRYNKGQSILQSIGTSNPTERAEIAQMIDSYTWLMASIERRIGETPRNTDAERGEKAGALYADVACFLYKYSTYLEGFEGIRR